MERRYAKIHFYKIFAAIPDLRESLIAMIMVVVVVMMMMMIMVIFFS